MSAIEETAMPEQEGVQEQQTPLDQDVDEGGDPAPLTRVQVSKSLSVLGRNPFTQAHVYTTATLTKLRLSDLAALRDFPHLQHLACSQNELRTLAPLQHLPLLLTLDAADNQLTDVLDFQVPKCTPDNAWVDGARWIGSLLRKAILNGNQITVMPRSELAATHPFLLELRLAHNDIEEISGVSQLRFLRVLDLSHNRLTSMRGLATDEASPRGLQALETLLLSHNQLTTIDASVSLLPRLAHLDVAHNRLKALTNLGVRVLSDKAQSKSLFVLQRLDEETVTPKEKVKALVMHGSDLKARRQVAAKFLPRLEFVNFLYVAYRDMGGYT
ncbi:hypothetical protein BBJ28_00004265 [Nothophytophthora sp. Chile5]|nr:hypothetical protein BBJ28_00004265 [Nothophytophthora sp. Chile5]